MMQWIWKFEEKIYRKCNKTEWKWIKINVDEFILTLKVTRVGVCTNKTHTYTHKYEYDCIVHS